MRKGNKAVSLLDTKRKLRKWELRGFFCTAMILKFHASLLYFSMIQCKSHQSLWLIGHKQRDVQYITVQPQVMQEETDAEFDFIREQLLGFTGSGPAFIKVKISSIFKVTSAGLFEEPGPVYLLDSLQNIKIMIARQGTLQYNVDMGNHRARRLTL